MPTSLFSHRGRALKNRAIYHIVSSMWSLPNCMPGKSGDGPKKIGFRAGFNWHSEFRRQYARGLILEAVDLGYVQKVPMGLKRNKYCLSPLHDQTTAMFIPYLDPDYVIAIENEGANIIKAAKSLVIEYMRHGGKEWYENGEIERGIGFYEQATTQHNHAGYWGWLVIEELVHDQIIEKQKPGRKFEVRFKNW